MRCLEITRKDLQLLVRDRRALIVLIALPMAFIGILGLSTGRLLGWKSDNQLLKLGVLDESRTDASRSVISHLATVDGIRVEPLESSAALQERLNKREITVAVRIDEAFGPALDELSPGDLLDIQTSRLKVDLEDLHIQVTSLPAGAMVRSVVDQLALFATLQTALPKAAGRLDSARQIQSLIGTQKPGAEAPANGPPDVPHTDDLPEKRTDSQRNPVYQTLVPSYTVMFAFFLVNIMARSFIAERELGTLKRLQMAPLSRFDLLAGKTLPFLAISLIQCGVLFLFGRLLFGMSWGAEPLLLLPIVFSTSLAATGLGLLIATIVRTYSQVSAYANFLVITLAGISGCFMPRDWLPELMQQVSLATPHAWALMAYDQALSTPTPSQIAVGQSCLVLIGFAVSFFLLGCWRFRTSD